MELHKISRRSFLEATALSGAAAVFSHPLSGGLVSTASAAEAPIAAAAEEETKIVKTCCRACIHNCGVQNSEHSGIHTFHVGKRSKVRYVERHYGEGDGRGENIMNPTTVVEMDEDSYMEMETTQIKGVDSTVRTTNAKLGPRATLIIREKVMTHGRQLAKSDFTVDLDGEDCHTNVISRSVAKDQSRQVFLARINGNARCYGHSECDAIIMDQGVVAAIPEVTANCVDASLVHEAAIGKIAGEQLIKLMTLGLTEKEAEEQIVNGFLK